MKLAEWIKKYEDKTGDRHIIPEGYTQYYLPSRGYAQYGMMRDRGCLYIHECCGDAKFWFDLGVLLCGQNGLEYITTVCTRDLKAYMRFFGWSAYEQVKEENGTPDGAARLNCQDKEGNFITISPAFKKADGEVAYFCTRKVGGD